MTCDDHRARGGAGGRRRRGGPGRSAGPSGPPGRASGAAGPDPGGFVRRVPRRAAARPDRPADHHHPAARRRPDRPAHAAPGGSDDATARHAPLHPDPRPRSTAAGRSAWQRIHSHRRAAADDRADRRLGRGVGRGIRRRHRRGESCRSRAGRGTGGGAGRCGGGVAGAGCICRSRCPPCSGTTTGLPPCPRSGRSPPRGPGRWWPPSFGRRGGMRSPGRTGGWSGPGRCAPDPPSPTSTTPPGPRGPRGPRPTRARPGWSTCWSTRTCRPGWPPRTATCPAPGARCSPKSLPPAAVPSTTTRTPGFPRTGLRRHVEFRDRHCTFLGCVTPARHADLDHTRDHAHGGPTTADDLGPACRQDHGLTHRGWILTQPEPGVFVWRSPLGRVYRTRSEPLLPPPPPPLPVPPDQDHCCAPDSDPTTDTSEEDQPDPPLIVWRPPTPVEEPRPPPPRPPTSTNRRRSDASAADLRGMHDAPRAVGARAAPAVRLIERSVDEVDRAPARDRGAHVRRGSPTRPASSRSWFRAPLGGCAGRGARARAFAVVRSSGQTARRIRGSAPTCGGCAGRALGAARRGMHADLGQRAGDRSRLATTPPACTRPSSSSRGLPAHECAGGDGRPDGVAKDSVDRSRRCPKVPHPETAPEGPPIQPPTGTTASKL